MRNIPHPDVEQVPLSVLLHALSDPVRLGILKRVTTQGELCCGACGGDISKPTLSHHLKVLREAGLIRVRADGTQRCISLRQAEVEKRCPGLLRSVLKAAEPM